MRIRFAKTGISCRKAGWMTDYFSYIQMEVGKSFAFGENAGVLYYGEVEETSLVTRKEINKLGGRIHPNAKCYIIAKQHLNSLIFNLKRIID